MDISNDVQAAERLLCQPYQDLAHCKDFLSILDADIAHPFVTDRDKRRLKELREKLVIHMADSKRLPFPGASACNI